MSTQVPQASMAPQASMSLDRRELLKRVAYLMGGALSAPAILGALNGCSRSPGSDWKPELLTQAQADLVAEVANIIIPRTDTPGARDVGVTAFIDAMLKDVFKTDDRQRFLDGLTEFEALAAQEHGRAFVKLDPKQREALVRRVHDEAVASAPPESFTQRPTRPFILMAKELTLVGFFMSEAGATQVLQYEAVPGAYHACVPLAKAGNGKAWAADATAQS
jgi:gluconate 2-dehydrogenase gamma chain